MLMEAIRGAIAACIGAASFGALLHAPRRSLPVGAAIGTLGYMIDWLLIRQGTPEALAMFVAALVAAGAGQLAARRMRMISTIFITIAILPLIPGLGLYRAMSALAQGQTAVGAEIAVQSMALILMIALGVAMGSALFGSLRSKASNKVWR